MVYGEYKITLYQIGLDRIVVIYVTQGIIVIFFSLLAYRILKRKKQRLNVIFSLFFICVIMGLIFNMIYAPLDPIQHEPIIKILNFFANFFIFFAPIFMVIVNFIILESTLIFSVKRQNRYIFLYGFLIFFGMLILILIPDPLNILGVKITAEGRPEWGIVFFIYMVSIITGLTLIPIVRTSLKIYNNLKTNALKKKWVYYFIGSLGVFSWGYLIFLTNFMGHFFDILRLISSIYGISIVIWVYFMYYGIGFKLKN
ncbi:MAG: hypothetical protein ACFFAN_13205 [Promethearchaeota archaeon]